MNLTIEEKIGQMIMVGINSDKIDCLYELIRKYKIGGVILYKKNYSSYEDMISVINKLKDANKENKIPLFIAIDQENGKVNRLPDEFINIKNIFDVSNKNDITLVEKDANIISKLLVKSGINMNFAPVLDIYNDSNNKALYKRCFSSDVDIVSDYGVKYMKKIQENKLIPVVKHFPGHGSSNKDSHIFVPYIFNYNDILNKHIIPFKKAIDNGCDAIMVGHLIIRKLTYGLPASLSKPFIQTYLRENFKYDGVIISDDIKMLYKNPIYRFKALEKAFFVGNDIVLFKYDNEDEKVINSLVDNLKNNDSLLKEINRSVDRIIKLKNKYNITDEFKQNKINIDKYNEEVEKFNEIIN